MSMPFSFIRCDSCPKNWATHMTWGLFSYSLPDGRYAFIDRTIAWCDGCDDFVPAEHIPDVEELEEKLDKKSRELESEQHRLRQPIEHRAFFGLIRKQIWPDAKDVWVYEREVARAQASLDWRKIRKSAPKCLLCGSPIVQQKELWDRETRQWAEGITHPGCGGKIRIEDSGYQIALGTKHRVYDTDGDFIREEDEIRPGEKC
jgi:hypothetical protein